MAASPPLSLSAKFAIFALKVRGTSRISIACLLYAPWLLPRSYLFGEDLVPAAYSLWRTFRLYALCLPGSCYQGGFLYAFLMAYSSHYQYICRSDLHLHLQLCLDMNPTPDFRTAGLQWEILHSSTLMAYATGRRSRSVSLPVLPDRWSSWSCIAGPWLPGRLWTTMCNCSGTLSEHRHLVTNLPLTVQLTSLATTCS